jgi:hypothetical protein
VAGAARAAAAQLGYPEGFTLLFHRPTALTQTGVPVYVNAHTPHLQWVAAEVRTVVSQQRSHGVDLIWRGYTNATQASGAEIVEYGAPGCAHGALAVTFPAYYIEGSYMLFAHAEVRLCAVAFRYGSGVLLGNLLHEMGHAVGLGHYADNYAGHRQVMNPYLDIGHPLTSYQLGDQHGLQAIAGWTHQFATELAPTGHVDAATPRPDGSYTITGWVLPGRKASSAGSWTLTEDGRTASSGKSTTNRADVDRTYHVNENSGFTAATPALPGQTHLWCLNAVDPASPVQTIHTVWCAHLTGPKLVGHLDSAALTTEPGLLSPGRSHITGTVLTQDDPAATATLTVLMQNSSLQTALWIALHGPTVATVSVAASHQLDNDIPVPVGGASYCFTATNGPQHIVLDCRTLGTR